jgi:hypothetical protein
MKDPAKDSAVVPCVAADPNSASMAKVHSKKNKARLSGERLVISENPETALQKLFKSKPEEPRELSKRRKNKGLMG